MQTRSYQKTPTQQDLFGIDYAPTKVREHGLVEAHSWPMVSKGKQGGVHAGAFRVSAFEAWDFPEIELRAGNSWPCMIQDLDSQDALQEHYRRTECESWPSGNWLVQRVSNGHTHLVYNLAVPVHRGELARERPLRELARISEYYAVALKADRGYTGILTHNPTSKGHGPGFKTLWLRKDPYSLGELARVIPFGWRRPTVSRTGVGRNCDLFQSLIRWAGCPENRENDCLAAAHVINQSFELPLPDSEVAGIAASVERYRKNWSYYTAEQKELWGRARGIKSGEARRKRGNLDERDQLIRLDLEQGMRQQGIALKYGLTQARVSQIISELHRWCPESAQILNRGVL